MIMGKSSMNGCFFGGQSGIFPTDEEYDITGYV